jgi:hypothetical protein
LGRYLPLYRRRCRGAGSGGMLMCPHHSGVHRDVPVDSPGGISGGLDLPELGASNPVTGGVEEATRLDSWLLSRLA